MNSISLSTRHFLNFYFLRSQRLLCSVNNKGDKNSTGDHGKSVDSSTTIQKSQNEVKTEGSASDDKKEAAKQKLFSLLSELKVESTEQYRTQKLNLAQAVKRQSKKERFKDVIAEKAGSVDEIKIQNAARDVAESVKGDPKKTLAELNEKLRVLNLAKSTDSEDVDVQDDLVLDETVAKDMMQSVQEVAATVTDQSAAVRSELTERLLRLSTENKTSVPKQSIDDLVSGMKIETEKTLEEKKHKEWLQKQNFERSRANYETRYQSRRGERRTESMATDTSRRQMKPFGSLPSWGPSMKSINIFDAAPLQIFDTQKHPVEPQAETSVWERLEQKALKLSVQFAPTNGFEEMVQWTEQGKHWKFPIDNETELGDEANVGFHEHVFLERHLHGFPAKGPVRHFMELVCVGLSKNPYITADRKVENIDWFREYFKDKQDVLRDAGVLG